MWHVDPLLGNDREISYMQQPLLSNGFANKHVSTNATIAQQQFNITIMGSYVFYVVRADML
jgi:hypothetical protein